MIARQFFALAAASTLAIASPAAARAPVCVSGNAAVAAVEFARFNAAWASLDPDRVTALFAPDAVLLPTLSPEPRTDPAGVRDYFAGFLKGHPQARVDSDRIVAGCNWLLRAGQWTVTLDGDTPGTRRQVHARFTFLYRRMGGTWRIQHLHSSLDPAGH